MAKKGEERKTDRRILKTLGIVQEKVTKIETSLIGYNGNRGALEEVKDNTEWRLEITGALKLLYLLVGTNCLVIILSVLKVI